MSFAARRPTVGSWITWSMDSGGISVRTGWFKLTTRTQHNAPSCGTGQWHQCHQSLQAHWWVHPDAQEGLGLWNNIFAQDCWETFLARLWKKPERDCKVHTKRWNFNKQFLFCKKLHIYKSTMLGPWNSKKKTSRLTRRSSNWRRRKTWSSPPLIPWPRRKALDVGRGKTGGIPSGWDIDIPKRKEIWSQDLQKCNLSCITSILLSVFKKLIPKSENSLNKTLGDFNNMFSCGVFSTSGVGATPEEDPERMSTRGGGNMLDEMIEMSCLLEVESNIHKMLFSHDFLVWKGGHVFLY